MHLAPLFCFLPLPLSLSPFSLSLSFSLLLLTLSLFVPPLTRYLAEILLSNYLRFIILFLKLVLISSLAYTSLDNILLLSLFSYSISALISYLRLISPYLASFPSFLLSHAAFLHSITV